MLSKSWLWFHLKEEAKHGRFKEEWSLYVFPIKYDKIYSDVKYIQDFAAENMHTNKKELAMHTNN